MSLELTGTIEKIFDTKEFGEKGFKKRELILNSGGEYPQVISIEFVQDKTAILDKYAVGDNVEVGININGRKWTSPEGEDKYFNTLSGWKINKLSASNEDPFA